MDHSAKDYTVPAQAYIQDNLIKLITKLDLEPEIVLIIRI